MVFARVIPLATFLHIRKSLGWSFFFFWQIFSFDWICKSQRPRSERKKGCRVFYSSSSPMLPEYMQFFGKNKNKMKVRIHVTTLAFLIFFFLFFFFFDLFLFLFTFATTNIFLICSRELQIQSFMQVWLDSQVRFAFRKSLISLNILLRPHLFFYYCFFGFFFITISVADLQWGFLEKENQK